MKKLLVVLTALCIFFVGCDSDMKKIKGNDADEVMVYVDPETGVNYLIYTDYYKGGITVRYNADGSVMVTKKEN